MSPDRIGSPASGGINTPGAPRNGTSSSAPAAFTGSQNPKALVFWRAVMTRPYVELPTRSAFSFLRGASLPEQLAERAAELKLPAVALCDRDGVYGAPRFYNKSNAIEEGKEEEKKKSKPR